MIDARFQRARRWKKSVTGKADWTKSKVVGGTTLRISVEIQVSARSDSLIRDVIHLRDALEEGKIDLGIIVVPSDTLGGYLTDRAPRLKDAIRTIREARVEQAPLVVLAIEHDGAGQMNITPWVVEENCLSPGFPLTCCPMMRLVYSTGLGELYQADCMELLGSLRSGSVHTLFADPPFNLGKNYGSRGHDSRPNNEYLDWSKKWIRESVRVLAPGGALFLYNLPKWLIEYGAFLNSMPEMSFKHWIAIDKAHSLPIPNRLSPSHYGMLFYVKGSKPRHFDRDIVRIPIQACRHCGGDIKDYGGHKKYLNPKGVNLSDVWDDVPPVRHRKYKNRPANELAPVILERVILLTTAEGEVVCDPFAGGGVTAYVAERLGRRWIAGEVNDCAPAKERLLDLENGSHPEWKSARKRFASRRIVNSPGSLFEFPAGSDSRL